MVTIGLQSAKSELTLQSSSLHQPARGQAGQEALFPTLLPWVVLLVTVPLDFPPEKFLLAPQC